MATLVQDLRYGARMLLRNPGFTLIAVITLALGIGANSVIFSLVNALLLRPLPVEKPEQLAAVYTSDFSSTQYGAASYPDYVDFRDRNQVFSGTVAYTVTPFSLNVDGTNERAFGEIASGNYFSTLGITPALGRGFLLEGDRTPGEGAVAVISHKLWQNRFGGDPAIAGRTVKLNGHPFTIVGVAPEKYSGLTRGIAMDLWVPAMMMKQALPGSDNLVERGSRAFFVMGRLKPGVTLKLARARLHIRPFVVDRRHFWSGAGARGFAPGSCRFTQGRSRRGERSWTITRRAGDHAGRALADTLDLFRPLYSQPAQRGLG